ncbi:MAG TPA: phosphoglycerate kinase, partial [Thermoanaerobaculia bacterium]|nr:phosphoglycerate kinase [Thermoanaerobaculia bacterium]
AASHLGRPKGKKSEKDSLQPVRAKLSELLGIEVGWASDCTGAEAEQKAGDLRPAGILLLENLRFHAGEEGNDPAFAGALARLADLYVNDAFGASHRAHASIVGVPERFGRDRIAAGLLLAREVEFLEKVTDIRDEDRPFVAILGGAKIKGKIEPLEAMARLADTLLIGGGMANTFLKASGHEIGASLVDDDSIEIARKLIAGKHRARLLLPDDVVVTDSFDAPVRIRTAPVSGIAAGEMAVDIGIQTVIAYIEEIAKAKTIFWNGPMGVFEREEFASGTMSVAKAVAEASAVSVVGGGESVEAVRKSGMADQITHVSTGGGASLEFIAGQKLPGVEILRSGEDGSGD